MRSSFAAYLFALVTASSMLGCKNTDSTSTNTAPAGVVVAEGLSSGQRHEVTPTTTPTTTDSDSVAAAPPPPVMPSPSLTNATGGAVAAKGAVSGARKMDMADESNGDAFHDYGKNAWVDTKADKLSTFAADVDTASFTVVRRMLREGKLPPAAAVRVEEFVNYFHYGYDTSAATADRPFSVNMESAASPFAKNRRILRIGVSTRAKSSSERGPANLVFLVDTSGSMQSPDKLELAKRSLRVLVDNLRDGDTVALVTYAGDTRVVLPATGLEKKRDILEALENLSAGGGTAMESGMALAYAEAAKGIRPGAISRVIVLSDGDANIGRTSQDDILATIAKHVKAGVTMSTIGFGQGNYQDNKMEQLANKGNGNAFYVDSLSQAQRVFGEQLGSTLEVVAKDVKLQVEFDPAQVSRYRLVGYENRDIADDDFRNDKVDAGEIGAGHQVTAVYELEINSAAAASSPIATVRVRHKAPTGDKASEATYSFESHNNGPMAAASTDLRLAFAAAAFADVLRGGNDAKAWPLADIRALVESTEASADRVALLEMIDQAIALGGGGKLAPDAVIAQ